MTDPSRTKRLAGVDIGTLTCRLLIADLLPGGRLREVRSDRRILRLGEGVDQTKQLSGTAMDRVVQCLKEWRALIEASHVDAVSAVATSAVRDAANRVEFLDRVKREAGFEVELISGEEEARRTMLGIPLRLAHWRERRAGSRHRRRQHRVHPGSTRPESGRASYRYWRGTSLRAPPAPRPSDQRRSAAGARMDRERNQGSGRRHGQLSNSHFRGYRGNRHQPSRHGPETSHL